MFQLLSPPGWRLDAYCDTCGSTAVFVSMLDEAKRAASPGARAHIEAEIETRDMRRLGMLGLRILAARAAKDGWAVQIGTVDLVTTCPDCCVRRAQA